ncbi:LysM domain-containing protein [Sedimentibacter sp. B4]|uniref:LysM peptidoglycan-binding domain-containing protein n=1 Tax=Sedimentibacter sp. B4 TaxID=304766 RepID=UPI0002F4B001|nr:LysM domain-containing protein [Sedimentibacter sp. B4]
MKKTLSIVLLVSLLISAMTFPAAADVDATSWATPATQEPPTATPTATPTAPTAPAPAITAVTTSVPSGDVYTVVSGDVFWKIAAKFNMTIDELAKLNPQVKNISLIYVGDKLFVKAGATVPVATTAATPAPAVATERKLYHGFGESANYRIRGEQKDNLNITTASVIFDQDGRIVDLTWDVMEITYALFPGWVDPAADQATKDAFVASIDDVWETKREEGYAYDMTHLISKGAADNLTKKEWFEQLDYYESFFKGMTVAEVVAWNEKYTDANGRPYKMAYTEKLTDADKAVTATFTAEEAAMLVDVTTSATMALEDPHSHFITALVEAYEAREEIK